jgi:hypothetical protein
MIPINLSHQNHETASLRSQRQKREGSSLAFHPKGVTARWYARFRSSLSLSPLFQSLILKTLHEKGENPNKKGKGRKK